MRRFLRRQYPPFERILLVESGSRSIVNRLILLIREKINPYAQIDLVTCYPGAPEDFAAHSGQVFRVSDYPTASSRSKLFAELAARNYSVTGIICSGEPIMTKWKWMLALCVPAKVFLINENADFMYLDWPSRRELFILWKHRTGLTGTSSIATFAGFLLLPFSLIYLLSFAAWVHLKRWVHLRTSV